jgi:XRE family transcriptional regulator of biofilm formation
VASNGGYFYKGKNMNFGKAIRIARSIADISQGELAEKSSIDRSYLSLIEGEKRMPTMETLQSISKALKIPFHVLALMATESGDNSKIDEGQVRTLGEELARLLLEGPSGNEQPNIEANHRKPRRPGAAPRNKKRRAA